MRSLRGNRQGFTIVELTLVTLTIAILAAIAMPRYGSALARYRVRVAAHRVATDLQLTADAARAASAARTLSFDASINGYRIPALNDLNRSGQYTVRFDDPAYGVKLISANLGGDTGIIFNGYGVPDSGGTVVLQCGTTNCTITVDAVSGRASIQ